MYTHCRQFLLAPAPILLCYDYRASGGYIFTDPIDELLNDKKNIQQLQS